MALGFGNHLAKKKKKKLSVGNMERELLLEERHVTRNTVIIPEVESTGPQAGRQEMFVLEWGCWEEN